MMQGIRKRTQAGKRAGAAARGVIAAGLFAAAAHGQGLDAGLLWSSPPSGGEQWVPSAVSIGNEGTQVFAHLGTFDTYTKLFSAHDGGTVPQPVWNRVSGDWTTAQSSDSAPSDDVHVALHQYYLDGTLQPQGAVVQAFRSTSSTPEWSFQLPVTVYYHKISDVRIADDCSKVVAYVHDSLDSALEVAVFEPLAPGFDPTNPTPSHYSSLPNGLQLLGSDLTADGSLLLLEYAPAVRVYDTNSGQIVFTQLALGDTLTQGAAISGDGQYLAYATSTGFKVMRRVSPTSWVPHFEHATPEAGVCTALDISADGSTIVAGYGLFSSPSVRVEAVDILSPSHPVLCSKAFTGSGGYDNLVADLAVSDDGEYFAAGFWGDQGGYVPELALFRSTNSTPLATYHQPGSVVAVDISRSGRRVVAGVRANHVNQGSSGGSVQCYNVVERDLALNGVPHTGDWVNFQWRAPGASFGVLLESRQLLDTPEILPGVSGSLYLPRGTIVQYAADSVVGGTASVDYHVPSAGLAVGSTLYFQGFTGNPRRLTTDWVKMTILP